MILVDAETEEEKELKIEKIEFELYKSEKLGVEFVNKLKDEYKQYGVFGVLLESGKVRPMKKRLTDADYVCTVYGPYPEFYLTFGSRGSRFATIEDPMSEYVLVWTCEARAGSPGRPLNYGCEAEKLNPRFEKSGEEAEFLDVILNKSTGEGTWQYRPADPREKAREFKCEKNPLAEE